MDFMTAFIQGVGMGLGLMAVITAGDLVKDWRERKRRGWE